MTVSALYWFWRGRLAVGIELGSDIGYSAGTHAALVTAVAFPWSGTNAKELAPAAQAESGGSRSEWLDFRVRVSPPMCNLNMPVITNAPGLNLTLTILGHLVLEYDPDRTAHAHFYETLSHTVMLGGRIRALDLRDGKGSGLTVDSAILLGYSYYIDEVSETDLITLESVSLRQDWDLIYWLVRNFGAGLSLSLGYVLPVRSSYEAPFDQSLVEPAMKPHGGFSVALVLATAF